MSFWRTFGFHSVSALEQILERDNFTLEELLEEDDVLQEARAGNKKLIEFLGREQTVENLLRFVCDDTGAAGGGEEGSSASSNAPLGADSKRRFKFPFVCAELLVADVPVLTDAASKPAHLERLSSWVFSEKPVSPVVQQLTTKVLAFLIQKRTPQVLAFLRAKPGFLGSFLNHLSSSFVLDLLLKVLACEDHPGGEGVTQWLHDEKLMEQLVDRLSPARPSTTHELVAQALTDILTLTPTSPLLARLEEPALCGLLIKYTTTVKPPTPGETTLSRFSNVLAGLAVLIGLAKRHARPLPPSSPHPPSSPAPGGAPSTPGTPGTPGTPPPSAADAAPGLGPGLVGTLLMFLPAFRALLAEAGTVDVTVATTAGPLVPLGFQRVRTVELLSHLVRAHHRPPPAPAPAQALVAGGMFDAVLDLFEAYPWNNFLHLHAVDLVSHVLRQPDLAPVQQLLVSQCRLVERLVGLGARFQAKPLETGAMGFVLQLACRLHDAAQASPDLKALLDQAPQWAVFLSTLVEPLRQVEDTPLGGLKPFQFGGNHAHGHGHGGPGGGGGAEGGAGGEEADDEPDGLSNEYVFRTYASHAAVGFTQACEFPEEFSKDEDYDDEDADVTVDPEAEIAQGGANREVASLAAAHGSPAPPGAAGAFDAPPAPAGTSPPSSSSPTHHPLPHHAPPTSVDDEPEEGDSEEDEEAEAEAEVEVEVEVAKVRSPIKAFVNEELAGANRKGTPIPFVDANANHTHPPLPSSAVDPHPVITPPPSALPPVPHSAATTTSSSPGPVPGDDMETY